MTDPADLDPTPPAVRGNSHLRAAVTVEGLRLSDGVVALDPLCSSDVDEHLAGEDEELRRWLSGGTSTRQGVVAYLGEVDRRWRERGPVFHFAIRVEPSLALAGTIDLQFDQHYARSNQVNLAYGIYPQWRRRGFATRAVNLAVQFLRDHTDARAALIRTEPANRPSALVAQRAGFTAVPPATGQQGMVHFERQV